MLIDTFGRQITYLRISVTDRCNLRCTYCMPPQGLAWMPHGAIMRYEEIAAFTRVAVEQGINAVRITGGEPLVRADLPVLVKMLADIPGLQDLSLTTNGTLLDRFAVPLVQAGLKRINVSLDTLNPERFRRITRGGKLEQVLKGIAAAERAGLAPIKINCVLMRGFNDDEIVELAELSKKHPWQVRFIELMPLQDEQIWEGDWNDLEKAFYPVSAALQTLQPLGLAPVEGVSGSGPAQTYRFPDGRGTVGFISPLSEVHFCQACNRMRLTADGNLRPCLMKEIEVPLLEKMRAGSPALPLLEQAVALKPEKHPLAEDIHPAGRWMTQIGG